jgi:hypothetical protein
MIELVRVLPHRLVSTFDRTADNMREVERIADQLRRVINGDAWLGAALEEMLMGVDAVDASVRPPGLHHSMHELVLHIIVWLDVVRKRLDGVAFDPTAALDWPTPDTSQLGWSDTLRAVDVAITNLQDRVLSLSDDDLSRPVPGKPYDVYHMLHGAAQHTAYHIGQIAVVKLLI